ncbi:MAG: hypothetical protein NZ921_00970 [Candidatus Caldarchaeum sp.]|nr:hypothetical protein [Candidatus Caldarchaeum sp.]
MSQSRGEGLDYFTKSAGLAMLRYIAGNKTNLRNMLSIIREASTYFEKSMHTMLQNKHVASYDEMLTAGVMKKKYLPYSAYMATISAYPLLERKASRSEIFSTVLAKMALILSIKVLDNINDTFHTTEQAEASLQRQLHAVTRGQYIIAEETDFIGRAENSCIALAALVNKWLNKKTNTASVMRNSFFKDFELYISGQNATFRQQNEAVRHKLTIHDYLKNMNKKGVGRVWVGLDLCMLEHISEKTELDYKGFEYIRKGFDYVFKSSNYYDDVADLEVDLKLGIWNSVVYLGKDLGIIANPEESLTNDLLKRYTIRLGDLHYLLGVEYLRQASKYIAFNQESLLASMNVFRIFTVRKWFFKSKNPSHFLDFLVARVPKELMRYSQLI